MNDVFWQGFIAGLIFEATIGAFLRGFFSQLWKEVRGDGDSE